MLSFRKFNWVSSVDEKNQKELEELDTNMSRYYRSELIRENYNEQILPDEGEEPSGIVTQKFLEWIQQQQMDKIIEIGCGVGRIWKWLDQMHNDWTYTGIEVDERAIQQNRQKWPAQKWFCSSVYDMSFPDGSFDFCFSFYVLEHLVFPARALNRMYNLLRPGGQLLLVFPDFSATKRFPSQLLGIGPERSTRSKLIKWKLADAFLFWLDTRKLENKLQVLDRHVGEFLINTSPACLFYQKKHIWSDIDAVYLAQKAEVENWASGKGALVEYPFGISSPFDEHTFMIIHKP